MLSGRSFRRLQRYLWRAGSVFQRCSQRLIVRACVHSSEYMCICIRAIPMGQPILSVHLRLGLRGQKHRPNAPTHFQNTSTPHLRRPISDPNLRLECVGSDAPHASSVSTATPLGGHPTTAHRLINDDHR